MDIQVIWPTHPFDWDHNILNFIFWSWTMTLPPILANVHKYRVFFSENTPNLLCDNSAQVSTLSQKTQK